jgi:ComF family protein
MNFWRRWVFSSSRLAAVTNTGSSLVRPAFHALFSLFFPSDCRICSGPLSEVTRIPVCPACLKEPEPLMAEHFCVSCRTPFLNRFPLDFEGRCGLCRSGLRGFDSAYCFGAYEGNLRALIHLYKYGRVKTLSRPLAGLLARVAPRDQRFDVIVPVPLHWRRQWQRGFNQSRLLANCLAKRLNIPSVEALRRARATSPQAGLSNASRRRNVAAAFRMRRGSSVAGKSILLVDDVMTTGSTAAACALALKRGRAAKVALLTIARVDRRMDAPWRPPKTPKRARADAGESQLDESQPGRVG